MSKLQVWGEWDGNYPQHFYVAATGRTAAEAEALLRKALYLPPEDEEYLIALDGGEQPRIETVSDCDYEGHDCVGCRRCPCDMEEHPQLVYVYTVTYLPDTEEDHDE